MADILRAQLPLAPFGGLPWDSALQLINARVDPRALVKIGDSGE